MAIVGPDDQAAGPAGAGQADPAITPGPAAHRVLVLGGARSGKSVTAEGRLAGYVRVEYVATGAIPEPSDAEWATRVQAHQERRPPGWQTRETLDVEGVLSETGTAPVLVECLSTWLARIMDDYGVWAGAPDADRALAARLDSLTAAWRATGRHVVAVSNEVGSGVVPGTVSGRRYRDELGRLNARIAGDSQEVWLCTAGIPQRLR